MLANILTLISLASIVTALIMLRSQQPERRAEPRRPQPRRVVSHTLASAPQPSDAAIEVEDSLTSETAPHGYFEDIAALLAAELARNPGRADLQRKLLEVYASAGLGREYADCARSYAARYSIEDPYWAEIARTGHALQPAEPLFKDAAGTNPAGWRPQRFYETLDSDRLRAALEEIAQGYETVRNEPAFLRLLQGLLEETKRWPTPLTTLALGLPGAERLRVKREERRDASDGEALNATGQVLLASRLGFRNVVSATRDGLQGIAVARIAPRLNIKARIYVNAADHRRYYARMLEIESLGAEVRPVPSEQDQEGARRAALSDWLADTRASFPLSGLAAGPYPFPAIVRDFQRTIGHEALRQLLASGSGWPAAVVAGVRDGYPGLGLLNAFLSSVNVPLYCVEPPQESAASAVPDRFAREHNWLRDSRRVAYVTANDTEALSAIEGAFRNEGLSIGMEAGRVLAAASHVATTLPGGPVLTLLTRERRA